MSRKGQERSIFSLNFAKGEPPCRVCQIQFSVGDRQRGTSGGASGAYMVPVDLVLSFVAERLMDPRRVIELKIRPQFGFADTRYPRKRYSRQNIEIMLP